MSREAFITEFSYSDRSPEGYQNLSLYIAPYSFLYTVYSNDGLVNAIGEMKIAGAEGNNADMIELLVNNYGLAKTKYQKLNITLLNHQFTIVPEAYAAVSDVKSLLNFNTGMNAVRALKHNVDEAEFCYTADTDTLAFLERTFPSASIRHSGAVLIHLLFNHYTLKDKDAVVNIGNGVLEIAVKEKNRLSFYNVFNYSSNEDILYFLLFTMEQLALDPLKVKIAIAGQKPADSDLVKAIKKYIRQVHFCVNDPSVKLKGEALSLPGHYYFVLLNQHLCEL